MAFARERVANWELALEGAVAVGENALFDWKNRDCCKMAADIVKAITGKDPMRGLRQYGTEAGAKKMIEKAGARSVLGLMGQRLGRSIPVAKAQRGDVVFAKLPGGSFGVNSGAGICLGRISVFPGETGNIYLPTLAARRAWAIGRAGAR